MPELAARTTVQFVTEDGMPVPAVTVEPLRDVDRIAVDESGPALLQMMENPGRSLVELVLHELGEPDTLASVPVLPGARDWPHTRASC